MRELYLVNEENNENIWIKKKLSDNMGCPTPIIMGESVDKIVSLRGPVLKSVWSTCRCVLSRTF